MSRRHSYYEPTDILPQDGEFSLIHISLALYPYFLQPILRVFMPHEEPDNGDNDLAADLSRISITEKLPFLNISITPIECSVVCTTDLASHYFLPAIEALPTDCKDQVSILKNPYMIFSVNSGSMESGQRVIQLTAPLAMAGISIFFITTYYTDFILVPTKDRSTVVSALLERGFKFEESVMDDVNGANQLHQRNRSMSSSGKAYVSPFSVSELQRRTLQHLKANNVVPYIEPVTAENPPLRVVSLKGWNHSDTGDMRGAYRNNNTTHNDADWLKHIDKRLYLAIISALSRTPHFFSLTLTLEDSPSILMDKDLLWLFGSSVQGNIEDQLVPIFLDLGMLPTESTGIVCGVGGMVASEAKRQGRYCSEMSYLSTARAGCVLITEAGAEGALAAMQGNADEDDKDGGDQMNDKTDREEGPMMQTGGWDIPTAKAKPT